MFHKARLGNRPNKQQKLYKNFFAYTQKNSSPFLICFYCGKKGYGTSTCYIGPCGLNNLRGIGLECRRSNNQFNNVL